MTKQIEVLKELPWAKIGERFEIPDDGDYKPERYPYMVYVGEIDFLAKKGWIKFIDEKKTLDKKLSKICSNSWLRGEIIEICRAHFLEALPSINDTISALEGKGINMCRKAIREDE